MALRPSPAHRSSAAVALRLAKRSRKMRLLRSSFSTAAAGGSASSMSRPPLGEGDEERSLGFRRWEGRGRGRRRIVELGFLWRAPRRSAAMREPVAISEQSSGELCGRRGLFEGSASVPNRPVWSNKPCGD